MRVAGSRPLKASIPADAMLLCMGLFSTFCFGTIACDKLTRRAKFRWSRRANHFYESRHPVPEEGALAIVTERWDGMWWTLRHRARDGIAGRDKLRERLQDVPTSGAEAYGKIVWI
jgi:hypothetical protein